MDRVDFVSSSSIAVDQNTHVGFVSSSGIAVDQNTFISALEGWNSTGQWDYSLSSASSAEYQEPSATQQCIAALDPGVRESVTAAYAALRKWANAGTRPNWEDIRNRYLFTADPRAQDVILREFAKFFGSAEIDMMLRPVVPEVVSDTVHTAPVTALLALSNASDNASVPTTAPVTASPARDPDNAVPTAPVTALLALSSASDNASVPQSTDTSVSSQKDRRNKGKTIRKNAGPYDKENAVPSSTASSSSSSRVMTMVGIARSTPLTAGALAALSSGRSSNPPFAAVSRPARKAIAAARAGQLTVWQFMGVVKWNDGAIDGTPLTHAEAEVEARKAALQSSKVDRAARLSHLRDSWSCILCGTIRYETIGRTSNLSKHVRDAHSI